MSLERLFGVAAVALCTSVVSAVSPVTKISAFHASGVGLTANPSVDGNGTLRYVPPSPSLTNPGDHTRLHLTVSGLQPNTSYSVSLENDLVGARTAQTVADFVAVLRTDANGDGVFTSIESDFPGDWTINTNGLGNPRVTIWIWDGDPDHLVSWRDGGDGLDAYGETRAISELRP
jgi:hypothetical protein